MLIKGSHISGLKVPRIKVKGKEHFSAPVGYKKSLEELEDEFKLWRLCETRS